MKSFLKKFPVFSGVLIVALLAFLGGWYLVWAKRADALKSMAKLSDLENSLQQLSATVPAPTAENAAKIEAAATKAELALAEARQNLAGKGPAYDRMKKLPVPTHRNDAYFDLASFIERLRDRAERAKVALADQEMFGFQVYAHTGPDQDLIPSVFQQRLIAQYIAETVIDARARRIVSFQRERPLTAAAKIARAQVNAEGAAPADANAANPDSAAAGETEGESSLAPDMFAIDPRLSAFKPGITDTQAFRVCFVCQTSTLRTVLNKFASNELPLYVRQLDVVSATEEESRPAEDAASKDAAAQAQSTAKSAENGEAANGGAPVVASSVAAPVPIVPRGFIKVTLLVEYVELASAVPSQGEAVSAPSAPAGQQDGQPPVAVPTAASKPARQANPTS